MLCTPLFEAIAKHDSHVYILLNWMDKENINSHIDNNWYVMKLSFLNALLDIL